MTILQYSTGYSRDLEPSEINPQFHTHNLLICDGVDCPDMVTICDRCGGETLLTTEDALDFCPDCGIVEGNTHKELSI